MPPTSITATTISLPLLRLRALQAQSSASRGAGNGSNWTLKTYFIIIPSANTASLPCWDTKRKKTSTSRRAAAVPTSSSTCLHELDAGDATTAKANSSRGSSAIESYFGRLNYNYDDRYLLTATPVPTVRLRLPKKVVGLVSGSIGWKVNNEAFLKDVEAINSLKLRLGWVW